MAYDEHADILGGPILQIPNTGILGQWSQYSILFRASLILALGLLVSLISLRAWDIWKKNQELGYRKAMRRKHGIPDSDCRPFAVAYAAATRARAEREAQDRLQANNVTEESPAINNQVPLPDAHGLRRRAAEPAVKPHVNQLPATRRVISGFDHKPNGLDFAHRYNPRLRDGLLPLSGEPLTPMKRSSYRRASRKDLVFGMNAAAEGKKRAYDHEGNHEQETSKKSRVDSDDLIDDDDLLEEEDELEPAQRGSKRTFDLDEDADYMRTDGRDKRPRNMSRAQTPEDQEMEDVEDDVAELHPIPRGKKRDRAEAGSTFGGDDEEEALDDEDDKSHRHRKRRTVRPRKSDGSSRGRKRDRDPESPASEGSIGGSHRRSERTTKKATSVAANDTQDGSQDFLCNGRKIGEEWESNGVQYKVGNEGERLRLTLVKKARSKYSMPKDSQHPDRQANMEIYVETWLTDEQYKDAEERQELVWQETPRASNEPSPGEAPVSPTKTGKDLLWDSIKNSPISSRAFRQSLTNGSARVNPFKQPLPQASTGRRVASSNTHTPLLIPGVVEGPSRPGFRAFSKWEKQDLEAEAMAKMRARMLEQKKGETPQSKAFELPTSATAPELGSKAPAVPIITFTPPPPTASTSGGTETKLTPSFSFGNTSTSTDASKSAAPGGSPTPASVTPAASAPAANKPSLFPTSSTPQPAPAAPALSFGPPTTQPPPTTTTTTAPTSSSAPSIPNFFGKPVAAPTPAPAATTVPSFSFGPTPAQPPFAAPTSASTNPFSAPAASTTETSKPVPFPFAKPSVPPSSTPTSTSVQPNPPSTFGATSSTVNPPSIFGAPSSNAATSTPSAPASLKFDFGKKPTTTIPKPAATSPPTTTSVDAAKQTNPLFTFSPAAPHSSPMGSSSPQKFSFGQPTSASVFGSGSGSITTVASKPAETSEMPKAKSAETETPKFSFGPPPGSSVSGFTGTSSAPKSTPSFGAPSGISAFNTALSSGGDAKKTDAPLSIFGAANATKEDGSKVSASTPAAFGGSSFGANANTVSSNIFEKSSVPQPSGAASTSTSTPKSVFGNATSSNTFSTTPAGSPVVFGSAQPGAFAFGNGSTKPVDSAKPSPLAPPSNTTSPIFSFGKKEDTAAPSSSGTNASIAPVSSTPAFAFGSSVFSQPSVGTSNGPTQQQSVFGKPSAPTPSAFGFGSGASGTGTGSNTFVFGGQPGGQNQQQ